MAVAAARPAGQVTDETTPDETPDTTEAVVEEPDSVVTVPDVARDRRRPMLLLAWGLSVLLVLALAGTVLAVVLLAGQHSRDSDRTAVLQAGRQTVVDFTTYKYESWDTDVQRVIADATGPFKDEFTATSGELKGPVVANKASSAGEVLEAGVVSMDSDSAQVLVVADATVTNTAIPSGQLRHYRIKLDLVRENGRWLTAGLQAVG